MKILKTIFEECYLIQHEVFKDGRGTFQEAYNKKAFEHLTGTKVDFVQDNLSTSKKGVLRGLHFQKEPHAQAKLIRVVKGEVLDVVVDLRKSSKTFGQHYKMRLSAEMGTSFFLPKGMAHGFLSLSDEVIFHYKCDSFYNPNAENGIAFNDPDLAIDWGCPINKLMLSEKDRRLPTFNSLNL
ncbi:dTDP-4-dehydrorhamnose 3,5-epimerase [Flagellimonas lutaonensis]|uniref:dTDP-4-dehydrorhamnose 3,5-epimerase n=1 Tax=Flagellimonas lutaonensis TaxID=516051 RepID=A0A0D5YRR7_9FLAO|nr:dTDP-4-dehydrorhamnose 3,5-epimerase [Allomuricauda lutaonensis]AKA34985.1 dTDP-4-dehydrorhamnose 3,5-epimerase [Allomuricauda lutaonensis]